MRKHNVSPEGRAKLSALSKARWAANREAMLANAMRGLKAAHQSDKRMPRPEPGTEARRLFEKIARNSNAAAAHDYFARRP